MAMLYMLLNQRKIKEIVIHCSASPNGRHDDIESIDFWHAQRGFARKSEAITQHRDTIDHCGYHYVITLNGDIQQGRHPAEMGAHAKGHNYHSLGVCLIGTDQYTSEQWEALRLLVISLTAQYPDAVVVAHHTINPGKRCPGFDVAKWQGNNMQPEPRRILWGAP